MLLLSPQTPTYCGINVAYDSEEMTIPKRRFPIQVWVTFWSEKFVWSSHMKLVQLSLL